MEVADFDTPDRVKAGFRQILEDFSQYLARQKQHGIQSLVLQPDSLKRMEKWGKTVKTLPPLAFQGNPTSPLVFIDGESLFYADAGGALLKKILNAMALSPDQILLCGPSSLTHIQKETGAPSRKAVVALGQAAAQVVLNTSRPIAQLRGRFHDINGIKVMPTYHPALLVSHPAYKRQVWEDMKKVMAIAGLSHDSG